MNSRPSPITASKGDAFTDISGVFVLRPREVSRLGVLKQVHDIGNSHLWQCRAEWANGLRALDGLYRIRNLNDALNRQRRVLAFKDKADRL
jgi:hypothetical protein